METVLVVGAVVVVGLLILTIEVFIPWLWRRSSDRQVERARQDYERQMRRYDDRHPDT